MKDNDLITRREVELVLLEKGQRSRRYSLGEVWELNFDEIREALSEYQTKIVRCEDCKHWRQLYGKESGRCVCDDMWSSLDGELAEVEDIRTYSDFYCGYAERR